MQVAQSVSATGLRARIGFTLAIASDGVSCAVYSCARSTGSEDFTRNKTTASCIRGFSEFGGGDLDEVVGLGGIEGGVTKPGVRTIIRSRSKIASSTSGSGETGRTSSRGNDTGFTNISSGKAKVRLISIVTHKLETVVVGRIESEFVNVPCNFSSVFLHGGGKSSDEWKRIRSSTQIPRFRSDCVSSGGRIGADGDGEDPATIGVLSEASLGRGFPQATDFVRKVGSSAELPISGTTGRIGGNVGDEEDRGHWAGTVEAGRRIVVASESRTVQIDIGQRAGSVENGTSDLNGRVSVRAVRLSVVVGWSGRSKNRISDRRSIGKCDRIDTQHERMFVSVEHFQPVSINGVRIHDNVFVENGSGERIARVRVSASGIDVAEVASKNISLEISCVAVGAIAQRHIQWSNGRIIRSRDYLPNPREGRIVIRNLEGKHVPRPSGSTRNHLSVLANIRRALHSGITRGRSESQPIDRGNDRCSGSGSGAGGR